MEQMERTAWTDERIDDAFTQLRKEMRDMRAEMRDGFRGVREEIRGLRQEMQSEFRDVRADAAHMKLFMLGGLITILTAFIALSA
jgi:hypothetical protein